VLDLNYGGGAGFAREYRERLKLNWGIVDADDCVNGAKFLAEQGLVDLRRLVISGGSADGYTALATLVLRDSFQGGGELLRRVRRKPRRVSVVATGVDINPVNAAPTLPSTRAPSWSSL
jgi:hypothetical protein